MKAILLLALSIVMVLILATPRKRTDKDNHDNLGVGGAS